MSVRYLIMNAEINQNNVQTFITWTTTMLSKGATGFYIAISTSGGNVNAGILMANYIQALPVPLTMHNVSTVGSIGIPVYSAAKTRFSNPLSSFVFHGSGLTSVNRLDEASLQDLLDTVKGQNDIIARSISETSGLDYDQCRRLLSGEISKSAEWAVDNNICQETRKFEVPEGVELISLF